jgi:quinolinate synthase
VEFDLKTVDEILRLKKEKDAFILAHNYQVPEIQDAADFVGDSLGLAKKAATIPNRLIVMCGVYFMAETVALLNPEKTVLIPDPDAGCPLASFADAKMVRDYREKYPDHAFVAYVNTSAEVKSLVDICCTSSNAVQVVRSIRNDRIVFLPDKNLGAYVKRQVTDKEIVLWPGFCVVHENADLGSIIRAKEEHPGALLMAHPECRAEVLEIADGICSTGQMFEFVEKHPGTSEFITVTEWGITHALRKRFPGKSFIEPLQRMECRNMKKTTADKLLASLKNGVYRVTVPEPIAARARETIEKMIAVS